MKKEIRKNTSQKFRKEARKGLLKNKQLKIKNKMEKRIKRKKKQDKN